MSPASRRRNARAFTSAAPLFAALGDETRLGLVARLCSRGPQSIARLTDGTQVTRQAVTKHLHSLADAGLVRSRRAGRERIWEIETTHLVEVRQYLDQIASQWDEAIERLRKLVK